MNKSKYEQRVDYYNNQLQRFYKDVESLTDTIWRTQQLLILEQIKHQIEMSKLPPKKTEELMKWIKDREDLIS